jgi:hypothetical protein
MGMLPNSAYMANITFTPKPYKDAIRKGAYKIFLS